MNLILVLATAAIVILLCKMNIWLGLIAAVVLIGFFLYVKMPNLYATKGNIAFRDGDFEASANWYQKAIATKRAPVDIRCNYAYVLLRVGKFQEAEEVLDRILRYHNLKPESRKLAKQSRCMVYCKQGRMEEAYQEGMELYEEGYRNSMMRGMIGYFRLLMKKPLAETTAFCEEAYSYNSDDRDICDNLAICYYLAGRLEDAKKISDELLAKEQNQRSVEVHYHGAEIAAALGDFERAEQLMNELDNCKWSQMTTISKEETEELMRKIKAKEKPLPESYPEESQKQIEEKTEEQENQSSTEQTEE